MSEIAYQDRIPNNVGLSHDRKLQRALEAWLPRFQDWWMEMGPSGFLDDSIYLRTATSVERGGWANFDFVRMRDYRFGIFLTPPEQDRTVGFGDHFGRPVWNDVPGEVRKDLRRLIVTQADTEPASVEQQRMLGNTAPSLYDLRNLFQVNVEEARHLWAMAYLLHAHFGKDGREEADELLVRRSGHKDSPRILGAFNKPVEDWLSFFMFTMFLDRDGKYQLGALAESAFDALARSTQFMLTEEAHHLFVGETGVGRIVARTAELMREQPDEDVRKLGGIPLDIIQKYIHDWYPAGLDLFGGEDSSNAATFFAQGLKGRFQEATRHADHVAVDSTYRVERLRDGQVAVDDVPMRRALNLVLRDAYTADCARAVARWNETLERQGIAYRLALPSPRFNRWQGVFAGRRFAPDGSLLSDPAWTAREPELLPTAADRAYVRSLMQPVYRPGVFAQWIAPPAKGIHGHPIDFAYVAFETHTRA